MKLTDMTVTAFNDVLASSAPAPGGGSASALMGALGTALIKMVAGLTAGKKKYAEHDALMHCIIDDAEEIRRRFIDVIDRDTDAFNAVSAVFSMPKDTDEQKAARKEAMQNALQGCTLTPFEMMCSAVAGISLADKMLDKFNQNAASDLGVAALALKAAVQGAWLNILINLGGIEDQEFVKQYRDRGNEILRETMALADKVYENVLTAFSPI